MDAPDPVTPPAAGPRWEAVVALAFAGVALLLGAVAVLTALSARASLAREERADGVVVDLTSRLAEAPTDAGREVGRDGQRRMQEYFYPVVEFGLPDGSRRTVQLAEGSWPAAYAKGEAVAVRYDPARPTHARIDSASGTLLVWVWPLVTAPLALAFAAAAAGVYWAFVRRPASQARTAAAWASGGKTG